MKKTGYSPQIFMTKDGMQMGKNDHVIFGSQGPQSERLKQKPAPVPGAGLRFIQILFLLSALLFG